MMANWFTETMRPRIRAGVISAMYIGDASEATPTPTPPRMRNTTKTQNRCGNAVPTAEARNSTPASTSVFLRPNRSLNTPASRQPTTQPSSAQAAAQPLSAGLRAKCACKKPMAPEITAVSYPNKRPPSAATRQTSTRYAEWPGPSRFVGFVGCVIRGPGGVWIRMPRAPLGAGPGRQSTCHAGKP